MNELCLMQKRFKNSGLVPFTLVLILEGLLLLSDGCRNIVSAGNSNELRNDTFDENSAYINFRSFQNPDLTWGFTIFINSVPYRHYNEIPFKNVHTGFISRTEAEKVANVFIKMIRNGESAPKLNKSSLDTLGITINKENMPD